MLEMHQKLILSFYMELYDITIPKDNLLRKSQYELASIAALDSKCALGHNLPFKSVRILSGALTKYELELPLSLFVISALTNVIPLKNYFLS